MVRSQNTSWQQVQLGDLLTRITYGFTNPMPTTDSGPTMVTAKDIRGGRIDYSTVRHTSVEAFRERLTDKSRPRVGDILLTKDGSIGRVAVCDRDDICINQSVALLQLKSDVNPRFLAYLLQAPRYQAAMAADADGSTIKHIYITRVDKMAIEVPDAVKQKAIAEVLGALDDKIAANEQTIEIACRLAAVCVAAAARDGSLLPVREIAELVTRGAAPSYVDEGGLMVLNQKCVRGQLVSTRLARRTAASPRRLSRVLRPDDVLINSTGQGTLGRAARWTTDLQATVDSHITIVRFNSDKVSPACAGHALISLERDIEGLAEGSTGQTELRAELVRNIELRIPPMHRQQELEDYLHQNDSLVETLRSECVTLAHTRDQLLPLLMSGKVTVKDIEGEIEEIV